MTLHLRAVAALIYCAAILLAWIANHRNQAETSPRPLNGSREIVNVGR